MKRKLSLLPLFLILFFLASCQSSPSATVEPTLELSPTLESGEVSATLSPTSPSPTSTPPEPALNAILQEVEGNVESAENTESTFYPAENGTLLEENGQVHTLEDGRTRIDLSSGTLIRMAPLSTFTLESNREEAQGLLTRIRMELGQIWIVLNGGSVEVETPSGVAAVRGSYMMVEIDPETQSTLISCLEGDCAFENLIGTIEMVSGQKIRLDLPEEGEILTLPEIEPMSERDFVEWLYFVPEAEEIFPFLAEEGILPWENWRDFLPKDGELPNWDELFPEIDRPLDGNLPLGGNNPLGGGGLPNIGN